MYPAPADVLAAREGTLAETPLPLLLHALFAEGRTVALELRLRGLEKRIHLEDGSPVACRSNLLHETLGKFLVAKGRLTEAQYQKALGESAQTGRRMGELVVAQKLVSPFELYRLMQANLALKILDAFRWVGATWRLGEDREPAELALRVNPAQLVLTGVSGFVPFDVVATQLAFTDEQRFALAPRPLHRVEDLKLAPKEARLVQALRRRPTFEEARREAGLDVEPALRRLYALAVLGIVAFAEAVPEEAAPAATATATSTTDAGPARDPSGSAHPERRSREARPESRDAPDERSRGTPTPTPATDAEPSPDAESEPPELRDALVSAYLDHRSKDPFALLDVPDAADAAAGRRAFLALADRFAPLRFSSPDLREKAEALLAAHARAYAALADPEQAALWRKRRAAAAERAKGTARPSTAEQFRISTSLLDGATQFAEGRRLLDAGDPRRALEQLQYAADIEPRGLYRAHLAWARFLVAPERHAKLALGELDEVARVEPGCAEAHFFSGEILRATSRPAEAEEAYRRAFRADPGNPRAQELALEMMRARKAAPR